MLQPRTKLDTDTIRQRYTREVAERDHLMYNTLDQLEANISVETADLWCARHRGASSYITTQHAVTDLYEELFTD